MRERGLTCNAMDVPKLWEKAILRRVGLPSKNACGYMRNMSEVRKSGPEEEEPEPGIH